MWHLSTVISKATVILWLLLSLSTVPQGKGVTRNTAVMKVVRNSNKTFPHYSRCLSALIAAVEATHYTESLITVTVGEGVGGEKTERTQLDKLSRLCSILGFSFLYQTSKRHWMLIMYVAHYNNKAVGAVDLSTFSQLSCVGLLYHALKISANIKSAIMWPKS